MYDVIIVGGGPAGLSAALMLGRCRRRVLVLDAGRPRNRQADHMHGYLTRDGVDPTELLRLGRDEIARYGVEFRHVEVSDVNRDRRGFRIEMADGSHEQARKLLLATGVEDDLPEIDGIERFYGRSVHHCPYCDGWEWRDQPIAVYGRGSGGMGLTLKLRLWSDDVVLCADGRARLNHDQRRALAQHQVAIDERAIACLEGEDGLLSRIRFADGSSIERRAMFFTLGQHQCGELARKLGCRVTKKGGVWTDRRERTGVPGLYLAGDASKDVQFAIVAAAEGANAAVAINHELLRDAGLA